MEESFSTESVFKNNAKKSFLKYSSIKVRNLINTNLCNQACEYIYKNEKDLILKYHDDSRGLTIDLVNKKKYLKYFEYPFSENSKLFGQFITSEIFKISEFLLEGSVYLKSLEIHSRCALGSKIPPHQDNAYYGLKNGKGLTFYIPINNELAEMGGLQYFRNPSNLELDHNPSDLSGFSLTVKDIDKINFEIFSPDYLPGDCTIHHSRSIHFANEVPKNAERSLVVRISIYAINEKEKVGHSKWYKNMIDRNRKIVAESLNTGD